MNERDQINRLETSVYSAGGATRLSLEERDAARRARKASARRRKHRKESLESADQAIAEEVAESQRALGNAVRDIER